MALEVLCHYIGYDVMKEGCMATMYSTSVLVGNSLGVSMTRDALFG